MKRLLILFTLLFGLYIPALAYAQTSPATSGSVSPSQVMSPEDMQKMRDQLAALSKAMGNPDPAAMASAKPPENNNMAKVADKALDMVGNAVATLSNSLSKIAPQVWRIMIIQQYAKAADGIIVPTLLLILLGALTFAVRKGFPSPLPWTNTPQDRSWGGDDWVLFWIRTIIPIACFAILGCVWVCYFSDSVKYLINPEYYAIKDILMLLTNPSGVVSAGS